MSSFLFLGVGNRERADDGVGPLMAERLAANPAFAKADIEVLPHSGEGASLMHLWEGLKKVVVVDCMRADLPLGTIKRFEAHKEQLHSGTFRYSSHLFGLAEATELARQLGTLPDELIIYGVQGEQFDFGTSPLPEVLAAMDEITPQILADFGV